MPVLALRIALSRLFRLEQYGLHRIARGLVFSPVIEEIRERGGVEPEEIVEALVEALTREYGSNPTRYPMQAILFEAEKP